MNKKASIGDILLFIFSTAFGLMLVMAQKVVITSNIYSTNTEAYFLPHNWMDLLKWGLFTVLTFIGLQYLNQIIDAVQEGNEYGQRKRSVRVYCFFMLLLIMCWLPCVLTYYPGGVYSDTIASLTMAKGEAALANHHPILYSLSWRVVYAIGHVFKLDEYNTLFIYTALQTIFMASVGAYFLYSLYRRGFSRLYIILSTAYFGLFNLVPLYLISLWKDTPHAICVFLFSTFLFNLFWDENTELQFYKPYNIVTYCILAYLLSFSRNNGFYSFIFFSIILVVYCLIKHTKKLLVFSLVISVILVGAFSIIRGPIYDSLHYNGDDKVESFGIPMQQVFYIIENGGDVPEEDLAVINSIISVEELHNIYRPLIVDSVKWSPSFNRAYFDGNTDAFLKAYLHIVLRNPIKAIKGMALANEGFWDITRQTLDAYVSNFMWPVTGYEMRDLVNQWFGFSLENDYSTRNLFSSALFAWVILASIVIGIRRCKSGLFLSLIPGIGLWLTILIATPLAYSLRYVFPLVLLIPMSCAVMIAPRSGCVKHCTDIAADANI